MPTSATWRISDFEKAMPVEKLRSVKSLSRKAVPKICATPPRAAQPKNTSRGDGSGASLRAKTPTA